jgi:hypothetical protein
MRDDSNAIQAHGAMRCRVPVITSKGQAHSPQGGKATQCRWDVAGKLVVVQDQEPAAHCMPVRHQRHLASPQARNKQTTWKQYLPGHSVSLPVRGH